MHPSQRTSAPPTTHSTPSDRPGRRFGIQRTSAPPAGHSTPDDRLGRQFGIFWCAVVCSDVADGIFRVVMPLLALTLTRSPLAVSAVGLAVRLPWLVVVLPAGVVIDRHPPMAAMRFAAAARLPLIAVAAALAAGHVLSVWGLVAVAFAVASAGTFVDISAQSVLPRMLSAAQLRGANQRLQSTQRLASQLIGPAVGGYAAALGAAWGPAAAAALYLAAVWVLSLVPGSAEDARPAADGAGRAGRADRAGGGADGASGADRAGGGADGAGGAEKAPPGREGGRGAVGAMLAELREGAAYFRRRPDLARLAAVAGLGNLSFSMGLTILPIWAVAPGPLGLGRAGYGLLLGALAAGGIAAGLTARPVLARLSDRLLLRWGGPILGVGSLAMAAPSVPVAAAVLAYGGATAMLYSLTVLSYLQTTIPRQFYGRAFAAYKMITWGVLPIGSALAGLTAELAGIVWVFIVAGLLPAAGGTALALGRFPLASAGAVSQPEQEGLCISRSWTPTRPRSGRSALPSRPATG